MLNSVKLYKVHGSTLSVLSAVFEPIAHKRRTNQSFQSIYTTNKATMQSPFPALYRGFYPGRSGETRTRGLLLPKQARYQLRYTRLLSYSIRLVVFTQIKRATNCAIPGYSISAIIPRRGRKSKIFLSVVIYVVKAAFVLLSAIGKNLANAGVTRLCGVSPHPIPDTTTALPNHALYHLSYTRL